jgi:ADP-ribosylglycohydrolase
MLGAIAGDVIGSVHEGSGTKTKDFPLFVEDSRFTDDTVLTVAVAERLLRGGSYIDLFHDYFHAYPQAGYGGSFIRWAGYRRRDPYNSWGNGSAMRVSPVGFACDTLEEVLGQARESAEVTHNHPEGIRGAQGTAAAIFLARAGHTKADIKAHIEREFGYNLSERLDDIRGRYAFDVSCQGSVPQSIIAFLEADSYEGAIRNAISLGGDADTMACIAGGIAEAFYGGVPEEIASRTLAALDERLRGVVGEFRERFADRRTRRCT